MKTLILAAIRCSLMFTAVAALFVQPAQAYMVTLEQVGSNVVANGSGPINLTGLTFVHTGIQGLGIVPASGYIVTGAFNVPLRFADLYTGFTGPASFGSGGVSSPAASTTGGDLAGVEVAFSTIAVRRGYVSGNPLSDTMTFNNATFASLGVIPGTYVWRWGTGLPNQNFTLQIGPATVPDGGSTVSLLGFALFGVAALRRKLTC